MGCTLACPRGRRIHTATNVTQVVPKPPEELKKSKSEENKPVVDEDLAQFKDHSMGKSMRLRVTKESSLKVRPPFPKLSAFSVDAIILSLVGYEDEVVALLRLLSYNTSLYERSHKGFYGPFLVKYSKEFTQTLQARKEINGVRLYNEDEVSTIYRGMYHTFVKIRSI